MGLFNKLKEPVFLKETSDALKQLEKLRLLEPLLNAEGQAILKQDIKNLEYGIVGEQNIAFELKNAHMPMYILHDIYLEDGELNAQIDYLVFTKKICFVIECKNLYGDLEINNSGDFVRTTEFGGRKKKEGIYSPITQNQRHLELMKKIKVDNKSNILTKFMAGKYFEDFHKSVVVLANPKTVLNAKYAKKEIKEKVIRADQLVSYIKDMYAKSKELADSEEKMHAWAQSYLELHRDIERDYLAKYEKYRVVMPTFQKVLSYATDNIVTKQEVAEKNRSNESEILKELKAYRLEKSREEKVKPYFLYNDNQLTDLVNKLPKTLEELRTVNGFGEVKVVKYGEDILNIIRKF